MRQEMQELINENRSLMKKFTYIPSIFITLLMISGFILMNTKEELGAQLCLIAFFGMMIWVASLHIVLSLSYKKEKNLLKKFLKEDGYKFLGEDLAEKDEKKYRVEFFGERINGDFHITSCEVNEINIYK